MNATDATALSGLQAAQLRLAASANNVANAQTPGYRAQRVDQQAQAGGGVTARLQREAAERVDRQPAGTSTVDLNREAVEQKTAAIAYTASLRLLRTSQRMQGSLLDTQA